MKIFYESGFEVKLGDIAIELFNADGFFTLKVVELDNRGNAVFENINESLNKWSGLPDEHVFLVSRAEVKEIFLGKIAPKERFDDSSKTYFYQDESPVNIGDEVLIDNFLKAKVVKIESPDNCDKAGGIWFSISNTDEFDNNYYYSPYITDDIVKI